MRIILSGKQVELSDAVKETIDTKLSRLDKYFNKDVDLRATVSQIKNKQKIEVTIPINKAVVRAEASDYDLYSAVDTVVAKLGRQLRKYKTKLLKRGSESIRFENIDEMQYAKDQEDQKIIRRKKFAFKVMTEEEAALQMEMLGHNFFVFTNPETGDVNILYKRHDEHYGLIEPEK